MPRWYRAGACVGRRGGASIRSHEGQHDASDGRVFFFSSRRRHTRLTCDWSSDVCSSDLAGVPVVPGSDGAGLSDDDLAAAVAEIGYPVLLKPSAGGGGKGMVEVHRAEDLADRKSVV